MTLDIRVEKEPFEQAPHWVIEKATGNALRLYMLLKRHARGSGRCAPSRATLAAEMGMSVDSIDRAMKVLREIGAVTVQKQMTPSGDPAPNLYTILWNEPGGSRKPAAGWPQERGLGSRTDADLRHTDTHTQTAPARCPGCQRRHDPREGCF